LVWNFARTILEPDRSPEVSNGTAVPVGGFVLVAFTGGGLALLWVTRRRSTTWLIALSVLLASQAENNPTAATLRVVECTIV